MIFKKKSRRMFLQGAGGTFLSIPFLGSLLPKSARAQTTSNDPKYIQLLTSESGHKASNDPVSRGFTNLDADTRSANLSTAVTQDGAISKNFGAGFNPYADKINIISNTTCYTKLLLHNECIHSTASGITNVSRTEPVNAFSIDHRLQQNIYKNRAAPVLQAIRMNLDPISSEGSAQYLSSCCYDGSGPIANPITSLSGLKNAVGLAFNSQNSSSGNKFATRRDLLSAVIGDYNKVLRDPRMSSADKNILEAAMQSYSEIKTSEENAQSLTCSLPQEGSEVNFFERHKRAVDIQVASLSCGITNIISNTIYQGEDSIFSRPAIHGVHHARGNDKINEYMRWRSKIVLYFIEKLAATPTPGGSNLLNDSLLYYGQEFADVDTAHQMIGFTSLLAGGAAGRLQTGFHIDAGGAPLGRVHITIMKAFGLSTSQIEIGGGVGFGDYSTDYVYGSSGMRDYDRSLTSKFFTNTEKRKALPIIV